MELVVSRIPTTLDNGWYVPILFGGVAPTDFPISVATQPGQQALMSKLGCWRASIIVKAFIAALLTAYAFLGHPFWRSVPLSTQLCYRLRFWYLKWSQLVSPHIQKQEFPIPLESNLDLGNVAWSGLYKVLITRTQTRHLQYGQFFSKGEWRFGTSVIRKYRDQLLKKQSLIFIDLTSKLAW